MISQGQPRERAVRRDSDSPIVRRANQFADGVATNAAVAATNIPEIFRGYIKSAPSSFDTLDEFDYNVFNLTVIECIDAPDETVKAFLATHDDEKNLLEGKLEVNAAKSINCQSAIWKQCCEKRDKERQHEIEIAEMERTIKKKVDELVTTHKDGDKILADKAIHEDKKKIFGDILSDKAGYCAKMSPSQITRFALIVIEYLGKTVNTLSIRDKGFVLGILKKAQYEKNKHCPETIRTTRGDDDNAESFTNYFKKMIYYVDPPKYNVSLASVGLPADATMDDAIFALHNAQKRSRGDMSTIAEERKEDDGDNSDGDEDTQERPSRRRRYSEH